MTLTRRQALALGAGSAALTVVGWGQGANATPKAAAADIAKFTGGKPVEQGKVSIEMPEIAENGNTVPLSVSVDAPMTEADHVTDVMVLAEGNPNPGVDHLPLHAAVGQGGSLDPHPAGHHAEHRRGRQDLDRQVLHRQQARESHHRRLRRLIATSNNKNFRRLYG